MEEILERKGVQIGGYRYLKILGRGCSSVVALFDKEGGYFALKLMSVKYRKLFAHEVQMNKLVNHYNITKYIESYENIVFEYQGGKKKYLNCIVFEYVQNGDLFAFVQSDKLNLQLSRKIFKQVLDAVDYIHQLGICHRDLKLENIVMDAEYNAKLGDFGLSQQIYWNSSFNGLTGTKGYLAPEVGRDLLYDGIKVDIFALGVILFILYYRRPPFKETTKDDPWYKCLISREYQKFWIKHGLPKDTSECSYQLQDLFLSMCQDNPSERINITDIYKHPWLKENSIKKINIQQTLHTIKSMTPISDMLN